eukprot:COSAG01_NODE_23_length_37704_cov_30.005877_10_plen_60_part_00
MSLSSAEGRLGARQLLWTWLISVGPLHPFDPLPDYFMIRTGSVTEITVRLHQSQLRFLS